MSNHDHDLYQSGKPRRVAVPNGVVTEPLEGRVMFAAAPAVYEAETAASRSGVVVSRNNAGYTGGAFVDYRAASGEHVEWTVQADSAGSYLLEFRYAHGGRSNRPLELKVNGSVVADRLGFAPTGSWTAWDGVGQRVNLRAGANRVRLTSVGSSGPNLDSVAVSPTGAGAPPAPLTLEAEAAAVSGAWRVPASRLNGATGFVDFAHASGDSVEWTFDAPAAGRYELSFLYANGGDSDRPLRLTVNGQVLSGAVSFAATGSWAAWRESEVFVSLRAGPNKVRVAAAGSSGPNVDAVAVSPAAAQAATSLRVYHVGNSVTNTIQFENFREMAEGDGREYTFGRHVISGAPLNYIWSRPATGFKENPYGYYRQALTQYQWDALTLQPFERQIESADGNGDLTHVKRFMDLALSNSPNLQVYLYQRWPRRQGSRAEGWSQDYQAQWLRQYNPGKWDESFETRDYFADLVEAVRDEYSVSTKPVLMIPVGDVMFELSRRIEAGDVPGLDSIEDLYHDGIHLTNVGSMLAGTTFYATMYQRDPNGIDYSAYNVTNDDWDQTITPQMARAIQDTVWDVVKGHAYSGVS